MFFLGPRRYFEVGAMAALLGVVFWSFEGSLVGAVYCLFMSGFLWLLSRCFRDEASDR